MSFARNENFTHVTLRLMSLQLEMQTNCYRMLSRTGYVLKFFLHLRTVELFKFGSAKTDV